jgi:hypothetical protein
LYIGIVNVMLRGPASFMIFPVFITNMLIQYNEEYL